jgi:putative hydrolase of the HAD superfamily
VSGPDGIPITRSAEAHPAGPVRAVVFDALGTLVALESPAPRLCAELARRGFEVSEAAAGAAMRAEIAYYLEHHLEGRDARTLAELRDRCAVVVRRSLALPGLDHATARASLVAALHFRAQPDASDALQTLRRAGVRLSVASNWDCSLPCVLASVGLASLLDSVVTSAGVGAAKPEPRVLEVALAAAGAGTGEAVHVGDSVDHDVAAATAAGVPAVLVDRGDAGPEAGRAPGHRERSQASFTVIRSLAELPALLLEAR